MVLRMGIPVRMVLMPAGVYFTFLKLWAMRAAYLLKAIGSAHDRILFMNDQVGAEQNGRHAAWERSVAAEADDTGGFLFENQASGLQNADGSLNQAFDFEQAGFADQSAGQNRMIGNFAEAALVIVFAAAVGYQFDAIKPRRSSSSASASAG